MVLVGKAVPTRQSLEGCSNTAIVLVFTPTQRVVWLLTNQAYPIRITYHVTRNLNNHVLGSHRTNTQH